MPMHGFRAPVRANQRIKLFGAWITERRRFAELISEMREIAGHRAASE